MKKYQHLFATLWNKAVFCAALFTFFLAAAPRAHAQSAEIKRLNVQYAIGAAAIEDEGDCTTEEKCNQIAKQYMYCDYTPNSNTAEDRSFVTSPAPAGNQNQTDPYVSSALIEYDQPYPTSKITKSKIPSGQPHAGKYAWSIDNAYPNHCLSLCMDVVCTNYPLGASTYSIAFPIQDISFDIVKYYNGRNISNPDDATPVRTIAVYPTFVTYNGKDYVQQNAIRCGSYKCSNYNVSSSSSSWSSCIGAEFACEWFSKAAGGKSCDGKYCHGTCWRISTGEIAATPDDEIYCAEPEQIGNSNCLVFNHDGAESGTAMRFCTAWDGSYEHEGELGKSNGMFAFRGHIATNFPGDKMAVDQIEFNVSAAYPGMNQIPIQVDVTNVHTVRSTPSLVGKITAVPAQPYTFVYRLSKDADVRLAIFDAATDDAAAYGAQDVRVHCKTNLAQGITSSDQCKTERQGLWDYFSQADDWKTNKDSTSTLGCCAGYYTDPSQVEYYDFLTPGVKGGAIVRRLVNWDPRNGEGIKGQDKDQLLNAFDNWDGRNDNGMLLPAGNYVASIQAKSQDEWPGIDFSRAVTRQVSLDPLVLTDVQVTGLNKKSTAYATISYIPTESSTVYLDVYTPGTKFAVGPTAGKGTKTNSAEPTGSSVVLDRGTGSLVARMVENRTGRMNFTTRWDGTCQVSTERTRYWLANGKSFPDEAETMEGTSLKGKTCDTEGGCTFYYAEKGCARYYAKGEKLSDGTICTSNDPDNPCGEFFKQGAPMPDGNYVYVLWAEIPYNGKYVNVLAGGPGFYVNDSCGSGKQNSANKDKEIDGKCFTGVKTLDYKTGTWEVERGLVGISIQPVSYSTIGSTPTAYGLDPFIFQYALDRNANVIASVQNTAGVVVRYLTPETGTANVAQQLNRLSWDGRDDQGRMVAAGTYMFVVEAADGMFPAIKNRATATFPVDMYRITDVTTTDVYGDSNARATISYLLSKAMNVQVNIYNKDVVIPSYNSTTGTDADDTANPDTRTFSELDLKTAGKVSFDDVELGGTTITVSNSTALPYDSTVTKTYTQTEQKSDATYTYVWTIYPSTTGNHDVDLKVTMYSFNTNKAWPPRVCNQSDNVFDGTGAVDPAKVSQDSGTACIYVNDKNFVKSMYPANATAAAVTSNLNVRLQPIKTFDRSATKPGDGLLIMEEWDAISFYNPKNCSSTTTTKKTDCKYETVPDGSYPFYIAARSDEAFNRYYYDSNMDNGKTFTNGQTYLNGAPFKELKDVQHDNYLYATEKPVSKINITRGPVYFLDGSVAVYSNAPQLFNASTGPTFIPPYEIDFAVSRAATVEIAVIALEDGMCSTAANGYSLTSDVNTSRDFNNKAGDICKFISTMTIANTGTFDANVIRKAYWDGTDHTGQYVKPGIYEIRLTARNYPDINLYQSSVKTVRVNANLFQVFDLLDADSYAISQRDTDMHIPYQISVPMKVAVQIFKPGTTIYDYSKGTLRNPSTGQEVRDINEVLVRAIVGIRPSMTLIDEIWDGRDYAHQEVPDGTYPFRFVTAIDSAEIDSVTGEIVGDWAQTDGQTDPSKWKVRRVADTYQYQNLHRATVAIGDGRFVCEDWEKTVFFYPNPLKDASKGTLEITKMPVPGTVSIRYFNLAGDLVRDSDYACVDANNYSTTMGKDLYFQPDNNISNVRDTTTDPSGYEYLNTPNRRNAALRCKWDRTNQHGKKVAHGVYFGLVDFKAQNGREHCQKVVKIIVP